ncbi:hypothetical protein SAMN02745130_03273 [Thiothrix eikelboomii]|uniref:Cytochrome C n=2 Tax=Thiothrix eikelboomii TaxID=92487 RepID=A0A1T4XQG9_9GAMM|nr:hypothetical protein SAMN02745130_03273 [Thiothrix eikelboomii]
MTAMKLNLKLLLLLSLLAPASFAEDDTRQKLDFPQMMQQHMLANMRDHLLALHEIQTLMAAADYDKAAEVAEQRLGLSSLDNHGAAHMASMMPKEMQDIGTGMHKAASQFAVTVVDAGASGDLKRALGDLSQVTQQCVACHSAYRLH